MAIKQMSEKNKRSITLVYSWWQKYTFPQKF